MDRQKDILRLNLFCYSSSGEGWKQGWSRAPAPATRIRICGRNGRYRPGDHQCPGPGDRGHQAVYSYHTGIHTHILLALVDVKLLIWLRYWNTIHFLQTFIVVFFYIEACKKGEVFTILYLIVKRGREVTLECKLK